MGTKTLGFTYTLHYIVVVLVLLTIVVYTSTTTIVVVFGNLEIVKIVFSHNLAAQCSLLDVIALNSMIQSYNIIDHIIYR